MNEYYEFGDTNASIVMLQPVDEHDFNTIENEVAFIREHTPKNFKLIAFRINDWNRELSPWRAPAVFGREDFGDGAAQTLEEIMKLCDDKTKTYYVGGYSLAGLFALWAAYQTDLFDGVAAASPSMWFPGFTEYMKEQKIKSKHVYLSLGDKEEKAKNPVMATVGDRIRTAYDLFVKQQIDCVLEWNEGNHFRDADLRTARAFAWVVNR
ncbi:MAG: esterase [Lachnospiraceae bacterium]|nr:esterase [Lachnospiraceae bacterium]